MKMYYLYILLLEGNNKYIGITENLDARIEKHFNGEGSEWCKLHKPIDILYTKKLNCNLIDAKLYEKIHTLCNMYTDGINKVRGAAYTRRQEYRESMFDKYFVHLNRNMCRNEIISILTGIIFNE